MIRIVLLLSSVSTTFSLPAVPSSGRSPAESMSILTGNQDSASLCGSMVLHQAICDSILLSVLTPSNTMEYVGGLCLTAALSLLATYLDSVKASLVRTRCARFMEQDTISSKDSSSPVLALAQKVRWTIRDKTVKAGLTFLSVLLKYLTMLIAMTFNIGLILAACLGYSLGSLLFEKDDEALSIAC
ncbi:Ctr copper transporter family-domain-containing protein [Chytriomyces sp. MP71]|nr:Ctr copper transporter family-domain-containing protein [Chytriomyces sp. MP71]